MKQDFQSSIPAELKIWQWYQKHPGKGLLKVFTLVLFSSLFLENLTVFILDFSLLSTLQNTLSLFYFIAEASSSLEVCYWRSRNGQNLIWREWFESDFSTNSVQHQLTLANVKLMYHGCHRHHFSKFPDFSLIKIKFPRPNNYKMSALPAAFSLNLQPSFPLVSKTD